MRRGTLVPVLSVLAAVGCAGGLAGPAGPVVSPTGVVYEPGTPPRDTRYSQTAALYLRSGEAERALGRALAGIRDDPGNPVHHFLAGVAHARLGAWEAADRRLAEAQCIYPAYELDVEPVRRAAWADAFNRGAEAWAAGEHTKAERLWRGAATMYGLRPEAHRNLAMHLEQEGRLDEAAAVYRDLLEGLERVPATRTLDSAEIVQRRRDVGETEARLAEVLLRDDRYAEAEPLLRRGLEREPGVTRTRLQLAAALVGLGRREEAAAIHDGLLSEPELSGTELQDLGVALFGTGDPARAAEAFRRLTALRPGSRDAWFNYVNALFGAGEWDRLVAVGDRLLELDPLNEDAALIVARAHLEAGDERSALRHVARIDSVPVHLEGLAMRRVGGSTELQGRVVGNAVEAGDTVRLRFTFFAAGRRVVATRTLPVATPAPGESAAFDVTVDARAESYRYELQRRDPERPRRAPAGRSPLRDASPPRVGR